MVAKSVALATQSHCKTETIIETDPEPTPLTARNDSMVNSFNPNQLSAWRANVDMQYIVSHRRVIDYCTKYVTKSIDKRNRERLETLMPPACHWLVAVT